MTTVNSKQRQMKVFMSREVNMFTEQEDYKGWV